MNTNKHEFKNKFKTRFSSAFICVHLWLIAFAFPAYVYAQETITVAVASSLYPVMLQKAEVFEKKHHVTVRLVQGSTGRLYNQIMQGAPFDLFVAADERRPVMLKGQGKAVDIQAVGKGYIGVMVGNQVITALSTLANPSIRHIAIANPDVAPFGKAARAVLQKQGLWHALQHKLVYAQNAMQAAMMVNKGLVDAGFVPLTSQQDAIADIGYVAVLLTDKAWVRTWLEYLSKPQKTQLAWRQR